MIHSPTLDSIVMVEKTLANKKEIGKFQLWRRLPRKMMYQTLQTILRYLEKSGKIRINGTRIKLIEKEKHIECIEQNIPGYIT
jgi:hypothetical protein